jgi:hypothetical protein
MINRHNFILSLLLLGACYKTSLLSAAQSASAVTRSDIDKLLDTTHPESHCKMDHDHSNTSCDSWEASLKWAAADCGHNEGAGAVIKLAVKYGLSYPDLMHGCPDSELLIPQVDEALKNPDTLDKYAGWGTPSEIASLKDMLKRGVPPAEVLASAPDGAVGEAWRRKAMIRFASSLAKKDSLAPAAAIAIASQWHNCQEFECLLRHPNEVALWLRNLKT